MARRGVARISVPCHSENSRSDCVCKEGIFTIRFRLIYRSICGAINTISRFMPGKKRVYLFGTVYRQVFPAHKYKIKIRK